jgi:hypothetical protein
MNKLSFLLAALGVVVLSTACPKAIVLEGCSSDIDCGASQRCDATRGQCLCLDDNACDLTEFCNIAGTCQPQLECLNNADCANTEMCDTNTGSCIIKAAGVCVLDSQCPYGSFCAQNRACTPGCRDDGDCALGTPCLEGTCDESPGACSSNSFCEFGQLCGTDNRCTDHVARNQLCSSCDPSSLTACGGSACLIDSSVAATSCTSDADCDRGTCTGRPCFVSDDCEAGDSCAGAGFFTPGECRQKTCQGNFCGADGCSETNPCPRGYACNSLQIVTQQRCTPGSGSAECGAPRVCQGGGENGALGFCSCAATADCPVSLDFPDVACVDPGPGGACIIGTVCGPSDGLLCEDLR